MRSRVLIAAAAIGATLGALAGPALANPIYNNGIQTALPVVRPAAAAFALPLLLQQAVLPPAGWVIQGVFSGRDDTSPWAGFHAMWPAGTPGTIGFPPGGGWFVYRPLWDPLTANLPAAPVTSLDFQAHWTAVSEVRRLLLEVRASAAGPLMPGIVPTVFLWCDPAAVVMPVGPNVNVGLLVPLHNFEFYKFMIGT